MKNREPKRGILRIFDPLSYRAWEKVDVVVNLTTFLESQAPRRGPNGTRLVSSWDKDLDDIKYNIKVYDSLCPSDKKDFTMELVISVNGYVTDDVPINYLKSINDSYISDGRIHITVFQRPNIGWQWGALQDIWMKWKKLNCQFWMTQESDCHVNQECWFDILYEEITSHKEKICFISGRERCFEFGDPYVYSGPLNKQVWRDKYNRPLENPTEYDLKHVDPLFYFISRDFLEELDNTYGCFTFALGANYFLDAIVYGEIGFCQKARALGYKWVEYPQIFYGWDIDRVREARRKERE